MAQLAQPVPIRQGALSAEATHDNFGMTAQRWNNPPLATSRVLGLERADGTFEVISGVRADTNTSSEETAYWERAEYDAWVAKADEAGAFSRLAEGHAWIAAGRTAATKPAWLP